METWFRFFLFLLHSKFLATPSPLSLLLLFFLFFPPLSWSHVCWPLFVNWTETGKTEIYQSWSGNFFKEAMDSPIQNRWILLNRIKKKKGKRMSSYAGVAYSSKYFKNWPMFRNKKISMPVFVKNPTFLYLASKAIS